MKRRAGLIAVTALALTQVGWVPQGASMAAPGDPQLVNFQHVYNYSAIPIDRGRGTDIEFYTANVPLRDYETGEEQTDENGNVIFADRDFAIMGSYDRGAWVFDITDPENVQFVVNITCSQRQNDVQIKRFGDRSILALADDGGGGTVCVTPRIGPGSASEGIAVFDVTDPYEYTPMYSFRTAGGAHNFTFHPTKPFGWVSTGDLPGGLNHIPIIDFTDVDNPTLAADIAVQGGPHDISFSQDGLRAFVASENNARIYDTTDPKNPALLSITPNVGTYSHGFDPTPDRRIAVHTNESLALGGFFVGGTTVCPGEGLTFYDIAGDRERNPVPVGYFEASVVGRGPDSRACTGHVGKISPDSKSLVTGWYIGGVRVVGFANPSQPQELGIAVMQGAEVWSAKFHKGPYIYAADLRRGLDVFKWTGTGPAPWEATPAS
ncbi:MAG: hypothetical protein M3245_03810 [Actinomycetota bacterium]|nr:hypothetical protein [Actinomycetota bacterium]